MARPAVAVQAAADWGLAGWAVPECLSSLPPCPRACQAGDPVGEQAIQLISISNRNLLEAPDWEACGEGEVARLREMHLRRHGRGLPLNQVGAGAASDCCASCSEPVQPQQNLRCQD